MSKRIVVKVGSGVVTAQAAVADAHLEIDRNSLFRIASQVSALIQAGAHVIVVSSGAVAMGMEELDLRDKPDDLARIQALAAVGQSQLMRLWQEAFRQHGLHVGQVLLTHEDLDDRQRVLNVRATLDSLLGYGVVPIINENDTVATAEITVGDNDNLASHLASQMGVDLLILLSTVDGLLDDDGEVVRQVAVGDDPHALVTSSRSLTGRGGMGSKLDSARAAACSGIPVVIANGKQPGVVAAVAAGEDVGTCFVPDKRGLASRKHWIGYVSKPRGRLHLDAGAAAAVAERGASVLAVGVTAIDGTFAKGDSVLLLGPDGVELGRGLARSDSDELSGRAGKAGGDPAVHRDDLVLAPQIRLEETP